MNKDASNDREILAIMQWLEDNQDWKTHKELFVRLIDAFPSASLEDFNKALQRCTVANDERLRLALRNLFLGRANG